MLAGEVQKLLVPHGHSPLIAWSPWLQGKLEFMGSKKKPLCDTEFREGAVRIVAEPGKPVGEVAEELGINPGTLHVRYSMTLSATCGFIR